MICIDGEIDRRGKNMNAWVKSLWGKGQYQVW